MRGGLRGEVRRLAFPAILHSLLQTLVFVVDRVMLGHHSEASLAAMQVAGPVEWSVFSVFLAFEVGTVARVGRLVGAGDRAGARRAALASLGIAIAAGSVVVALSPVVLALLPLASSRASPAVLEESRAYLGVTLLAAPIMYVSAMATATLQASGDTRTPLAIGVVANALHVAMNRVLILGGLGIPALGMRGCAISTALTFGLEALLAVLALTRRGRAVSLRRDADAPDAGPAGGARTELRAIVGVGWPAMLERALYHAGFLAYVAIIGRLGDASMAANQALISVESICFLSADGFGVAAATLVAQKLGAGRPGEAVRAAGIATRDAIAVLSTLGLLVLVGRSVILPLFTSDANVVRIGLSAVPVLAIAQPFMAGAIVMAQALRGAGRTRLVLAVSFVGAVLVRLSCTWALAIEAHMGLRGVWLGSTCDWAVRAGVLAVVAVASARAVFRATGTAPSPPPA